MDKKLALETIKNDILEGLKKAKSIMFATDEQVEEVKEELSVIMEETQAVETAAEMVVEKVAEVEAKVEEISGGIVTGKQIGRAHV